MRAAWPARVRARFPEVPVWEQAAGMDVAHRDAFLARFAPGGRALGFAVLGGVFGEGVDLSEPPDRCLHRHLGPAAGQRRQ